MKIIFLGRSKIGYYCQSAFDEYQVNILNPNSFKIDDFNNADIIFYARNISIIDFNFLNKLKDINNNTRFIFLDTELNKKNRFIINVTLLIKKIEYYFLSKHFKNIERYYLPVVLGRNMNWSISLDYMSANNIPLLCSLSGKINTIKIETMLRDIIELKKLNKVSVSLENFAIENKVKLIVKGDRIFSSFLFYFKYNLFTSSLLLSKRYFINQQKTNNPNRLNKNSVRITGFYKLIINE